jgi:transposase
VLPWGSHARPPYWRTAQRKRKIRAYYARLRAKGNAATVALVACMRKLLTILNAMVRDQTCWR